MIGRCKTNAQIQKLSGISSADWPTGGFLDLSTIIPRLVDTWICPYIDYWGFSNKNGSMITFNFALFDENKDIIGLTSTASMTAGVDSVIDASGNFIGSNPGNFNIGSARFVAPVIRDVTTGVWQFNWRYYGILSHSY